MQNVVRSHGGWGVDCGPVRGRGCKVWDGLPTIEQVEELIRVTGYSYEAGEFPDEMSDYARTYTDGDGGLLNALSHLKRALYLLPSTPRAG